MRLTNGLKSILRCISALGILGLASIAFVYFHPGLAFWLVGLAILVFVRPVWGVALLFLVVPIDTVAPVFGGIVLSFSELELAAVLLGWLARSSRRGAPGDWQACRWRVSSFALSVAKWVHSSTMDQRSHQLPPTPLTEPDKQLWRVAAGIPFRVRPAALAEPDLVRYTIRLPAGVIHRGFPRCETNQSCGHGLNPLSVGPCFSDSFSPTDTPSLRPHYRTSSLLWVSPTSARLRPLPRCLGLSEGAHPRVRRLTDLPGYHAFSL